MPAWLTLQLAWRLAPWLLMAGAGVAAYIFYLRSESADLRADQAEHALDQAVQVNKDNEKFISQLQQQALADAALAAKEIEAAKKRAAAITVIKKEQRRAPDANDIISQYDVDFFDRLRQSRGSD